ncbi:YopX family protein [Clostridium sporogenes]|uniref:YopX protein domain-containing protein n=1 Tax=Clostridium botulinum TaxID=1491 RepID=A0A6M0SVG4_CLOBO|nr:YopX family protein [Clostridium sporogenes]NFA59486.1 hypothetical protein [Clostridium botulinum]NFI74670.1 hypothetical protein [Clostridium sporogenes]NFL71195.1 hypothetical protein [Clostridium sporogenes]NFM26126.1 hypothetical protein [Clostridium sporogenes]NFP62468.1 hypothetical protein [Clostridium sporogenes]
MREIKFRFWDNVINNMYYGEEVSKSKNELRHNWYCITKEEGLMVGNVGPSGMDNYGLIVMQYTDLKDINGKEIYEGDIVHLECMLISDEIPLDGVVVFEEGTWWVENEEERRAERLWGECNYLRVKGNIYANPELAGD